jgi:hypothetical protein
MAVKKRVHFNRRLLTTSSFDSGALGPLVSLVHRAPAPGTYQVVVLRGDQRVGRACFRVTDDKAGTQLNIDLTPVAGPIGAGVRCPCREHPESAPTVSPHGYVLFHVSRGVGGYAVVVGEAKEGSQAVFDSRALADGDMFALSFIVPATYAVTSPGGAGQAEIQVAPTPPGTNLRAVAPASIEATRQGFQPGQVSVHAGQGVVFRVRGASRIVITRRPAAAAPRRAAAPGAPARRIRRHVRIRNLR